MAGSGARHVGYLATDPEKWKAAFKYVACQAVEFADAENLIGLWDVCHLLSYDFFEVGFLESRFEILEALVFSDSVGLMESVTIG